MTFKWFYFFLTVVANAATIYVSPDGSNSNTGLSPATPLRTLSAAAFHFSITPTIKSIRLRRNATYINDPLSLALTSPFILSDYGDKSLPRPYLQHARGINNIASACIHLHGDLTNLYVGDLHFSGCSRGLVLATSPTITSKNITIQNNIFKDIRTPFFSYTPPSGKWAPAILLDGGNLVNLTVKNNVATRIDVFFSSTAYVTGMNLDSNTVLQCSGNCYSLGSGVGLVLENSVFLRDMSTRLFLYGTTDVIVGGLTGMNQLINNDFNQRSEYQSGPDGCAFDFETAATGFQVTGNTFSKSFGAGIMIFGHSSTSKNITIANNVFDKSGCLQARQDQGGISVMCPNGHKPTGNVRNNIFFNCDSGESNAKAIFIAPDVPGCAAGLNMIGNNIYNSTAKPLKMVTEPQINLNPPAPTDTATTGTNTVVASTTTVGATLRYTLNGARPSITSPIVPSKGIVIAWPGPILQINVRGFKANMLPSITNGAFMPLNYGFGRMALNSQIVGPNNEICGKGIAGNIDAFNSTDGSGSGWSIDYLAGQGGKSEPVVLRISIDGEVVDACVSNENRPDLVAADVAPDPFHGFSFVLSKEARVKLMTEGDHRLEVVAVGSPSSVVPTGLSEKGSVVCRSGSCLIE